MRVHIKTTGKFRCIIPMPLWVLGFTLKLAAKYGIKKHIPEEQRMYMEALDFNELNKAIKVLSKYRGMEIVNVNGSDGTRVKIIL